MVAIAAIRARRSEILRIAAKHGARNVRLFGSVTRGESRPGSDLDVLVDFDDDRSLLDHIALKQELEDLLGCGVDVVEEVALHAFLRDQVRDEAVAL